MLTIPGCAEPPKRPPTPTSNIQLRPAILETASPTLSDRSEIALARSETGHILTSISGLPAPTDDRLYQLRIGELALAGGGGSVIRGDAARVFQVLDMPLDLYRAGYIRHSGRSSASASLPRALLPVESPNGLVTINRLRDPARPFDRNASYQYDQPLQLWIDIQTPPQIAAGLYVGHIDLIETGNTEPLSRMEVRVTVYDFVLSDERNLRMVAEMPWADLHRLWPGVFEAVSPRLMNREEEPYKQAVRTLDQLVTLAQRHRVEVVVPRLQPTVKWPAGQAPEVDWRDFDSVIKPWLNGDAFDDRIPIGFWPLPAIDFLDNYPTASRLQYWAAAASHFDQLNWLARAPVWIEPPPGRRPTVDDRIAISAEAARILTANGNVRVAIPLEPDQIEFATESNPGLVDPRNSGRLLPASPGLISATPIQQWPPGAVRPPTWLRTDLPGLIPFVGAGGDETDVRVWSWLAFLRNAPLIRWRSALPSHSVPTEPGDPNELVWFYPGHWFGIDEPVPTVQLKWLRRAQQDYEYLNLARQRGEVINALLMARLLAKPVEIQPNQDPDPGYSLMTGTPGAGVWDEALSLLARNILLRDPGVEVNETERVALNLETLQWMQPKERPIVMPRIAEWTVGEPVIPNGPPWFYLRLGVDIYNASDVTPDKNSLEYSSLPPGWEVRPEPIELPALAQYRVQTFSLAAKVDPMRVVDRSPPPTALTFTHGFTRQRSQAFIRAPLVNSVRKLGGLSIDGSLGDWIEEEAIQTGPLVRLFDRPNVQQQVLAPAGSESSIYTGWTDEQFYIAFKVGQVPTRGADDVRAGRNYVEYQFGRAWGEDLVQLLVQPIYADNSVGPLLHVVVKPNGSSWSERKTDPRQTVTPWQPFEGGVRYQCTVAPAENAWRGELAIPWRAFERTGQQRPVALRFNFIQHKSATGESASWAGPIDAARDDRLTGMIYLKELDAPGMR